MITFSVVGLPKGKGSKRAFIANGKAHLRDSAGMDAVIWQDAVARAARDQAELTGRMDGALSIHIVFRFPMPKGRSKADRQSGCRWKSTAPDCDKLQRVAFDGLQAGGLIANDALIAHATIFKVEVTGWTGAVIALQPASDYSLIGADSL